MVPEVFDSGAGIAAFGAWDRATSFDLNRLNSKVARIGFVGAAVSPDPRRFPRQHNPLIVVENRSLDLKWDWSATPIKDIRCSGILSVVDLTVE